MFKVNIFGWQTSPLVSYQYFWDLITGTLFQGRTRDSVVWFCWPKLCERKWTCLVGRLWIVNGLFEYYFQRLCLPVLYAVRNRTKIASDALNKMESWSFPMILFVWSTVCWSLVIFRLSCLGHATELHSWSSWLWSRNSSPFPPSPPVVEIVSGISGGDGLRTNSHYLSARTVSPQPSLRPYLSRGSRFVHWT